MKISDTKYKTGVCVAAVLLLVRDVRPAGTLGILLAVTVTAPLLHLPSFSYLLLLLLSRLLLLLFLLHLRTPLFVLFLSLPLNLFSSLNHVLHVIYQF